MAFLNLKGILIKFRKERIVEQQIEEIIKQLFDSAKKTSQLYKTAPSTHLTKSNS